MTHANLKDFLISGAFLQVSPDHFRLIIGPFRQHTLAEINQLKNDILLYRPTFWSFLNVEPPQHEKQLIAGKKSLLFNREEFIEFLSTDMPEKPNIHWKPINETQFRTQFDWSRKLFSEKKLFKTVPIISQKAETEFKYENLQWCLQNLIQNKNFGWSYGFFENMHGFLGHTPEVLAHWNRADRQLHSVALAGTLENTPGAVDKILEDHKILQEHAYVVDDINNKLSELSFKSKSIQGPTDVLRLKHLIHLITEFQLEADNINQVLEVIHKLHPTAAMGIYPNDKDKFAEFSRFQLQKERSFFGAPFALLEPDAVSCVVCIRNIIFSPRSLEIFSGCGVTEHSIYISELEELTNKRESVKKMMGLL